MITLLFEKTCVQKCIFHAWCLTNLFCFYFYNLLCFTDVLISLKSYLSLDHVRTACVRIITFIFYNYQNYIYLILTLLIVNNVLWFLYYLIGLIKSTKYDLMETSVHPSVLYTSILGSKGVLKSIQLCRAKQGNTLNSPSLVLKREFLYDSATSTNVLLKHQCWVVLIECLIIGGFTMCLVFTK